jgi:molybdate transport system substrate-binding protein
MTLAAATRCAAVVAAAIVCAAPAAAAETLVVLSSNGVRAALEELAPQCEQRVGRQMLVEYGTSTSIRERVAAGAKVDVAVVTSEVVAELAKGGQLAPDSITPLGRAGIGLGIREGGHKYAIGTADEIRQALLTARSITYAQDGASRVHLERMFAELGIAAEMKAKTLLEQGSTRAAAKVVAGDAEILLTLISEILPVEGLELLGPLPGQFQSYISFAAAVGTQPQDRDDARAFIACVANGEPAKRTFAAKGIER